MNRVQVFLTKIWLRLMKAKFIRISEIELSDGEKQTIIIFSSKEPLLLGQVTPFNTTIIHERVFRSERLLNYTIAHESAHKRQWYRYIIYPLTFFWVSAPFALSLGIVYLMNNINPLNDTGLITSIILLAIGLIFFLIPFMYSWLIEFLADCQAIKELGSQYILEALSEARKDMQKPDLSSRIMARMTHPPISFTIAVYKFIHRHDRSNS